MPKNKEMLRMLKDILKLRELPIPVRHAQGVLGPGSDAGTARRLRAALIMRPRDPDFGPVPGASPELKVSALTLLCGLLRAHAIFWQGNMPELCM